MTWVVALILLILAPLSASAQTSAASEYEKARFDLERPVQPGGPNADAYSEARERAEALEREGAWADALEQWEAAFLAVEKALRNAEFGTSPMTIGLPPHQFTMQMPKGWNHRGEIRDRAAMAAHRAKDATMAMRWADHDAAKLLEFEADARARGLDDQADQYRVALLGQELDALTTRLSSLRARTDKQMLLLGLYALALFFIAAAVMLRHLRPRPRFTYLRSGRHARSLRSPPFDWGPTFAAAAGGVFGLAVVSRLVLATYENAARDSGVVFLIVSVLATGVVIWVFMTAITRTPAAAQRSPQALDDLEPVKTEALFELRAWFDANAREICRDFGIGPFRRGRLDRTLPPVADPMLRTSLAGLLGERIASRSGAVPRWLDELVEENIGVHPPGAWEPVLGPYIRSLPPPRREALLDDLPAGAPPIFGGAVRDGEHTGPIAQWLEYAMVSGRRWPAATWERMFAESALVDVLQSVIWGAYDDGELVRSFRFDAEGGLAALGYDTLSAASVQGLTVGVAHVIDLDEGDRRAWEQELADFETIALFDQLGRPTERPTWRTGDGAWLDLSIPLTPRAMERLLDRGWEATASGLRRPLRPFGLTARALIDPHDHLCTALTFHMGYIVGYHEGSPIEPRRVSEIAVSEALFELHQVREN